MSNSSFSSLTTFSLAVSLLLAFIGIQLDFSSHNISRNLESVPYGLAVDIAMEYNLFPMWINHPKLFEMFEIVRYGGEHQDFYVSGQIFDKAEANAYISLKQTVEDPFQEGFKKKENLYIFFR